MHIILLSGGSGKRLWPLSNNIRSKQFLKVLPSPNGGRESMLQRIVRQIKESNLNADLTIATSEIQKDIILSQLGSEINIVTEPQRRDTFPAIAIASEYLIKEKETNDGISNSLKKDESNPTVKLRLQQLSQKNNIIMDALSYYD